LQRAIRLDPNFAMAYASLGCMVTVWRDDLDYDSFERRGRARLEARTSRGTLRLGTGSQGSARCGFKVLRRPPSTLLFESTDAKRGDESELFQDVED